MLLFQLFDHAEELFFFLRGLCEFNLENLGLPSDRLVFSLFVFYNLFQLSNSNLIEILNLFKLDQVISCLVQFELVVFFYRQESFFAGPNCLLEVLPFRTHFFVCVR